MVPGFHRDVGAQLGIAGWKPGAGFLLQNVVFP
jgi:hypothetical protein